MLIKYLARALAVLAAGIFMAPLAEGACTSASNIKEQFNGGTTVFSWLSFNGACLTAGTGTTQNALPGCLASTYYNGQIQVGGANGFLGTSTVPSSGANQSPDPVGQGALRLTNGYLSSLSGATNSFAYGFSQNGAILSEFCFPSNGGLQLTFTTVTYEGNSGGNGGSGSVNASDGADGISFFLVNDAAVGTAADTPLDSGAFGGSLGYTCSNTNNDSTKRSDGSTRGYDGLVGAYLGLGIDEFGNFLNPSDNTASGPGLQAGRIGLRGAGNISWKWLNATYPDDYPSSWSLSQQQAAVQNTCKAGYLMDSYQPKNSSGAITQYGHYYTSTTLTTPTTSNSTTKNGTVVAIPVLDYPMITDINGNGAFKVLPAGTVVAAEGARSRADSKNNPITYNLKITQEGLLTFQYAYNGGPWQPVITGSSIVQNGTMPANFRFGFAGSTGGSTNVHEILCFNATPSEGSNSSGGVNVYQNPTIKSGTQVFVANYFPDTETGQLTAQTIGFNGTAIVANTTPSWDASCVLTGIGPTTGMPKCVSTGVTSQAAEAPASRTMLTWNSATSTPIPFEYGSLSTAEQNAIDAGDPSNNKNRVNFLRGDRTNETTSTAAGLFRQRFDVLGDIVNSSPTWVGPPQTYVNMNTWVDQTQPTVAQPENSGQTYAAFQSSYQGRANVVYVGANDGFLHGFRAGSLDSSGNLLTSPTANDGKEILAYMPGAVLQTIHNATQPELDYSNTLYAHAWFVDATPGTGDLFYSSSTCPPSSGGCWHTWLVGGLGAGGAAIYMLDVTDPSGLTTSGLAFSETTPAATVIGEWTPANLTCANTAPSAPACGTYMGNTYGTPLIRRFHNGQWGVIFGNGYGSSAGTAGIFIMLIDPNTAAKTFYYLPTSSSATQNGIGSTTSADLDLDHVVDYIYAGDLQGNVWRFDVTSSSPSSWAVSASSPLFKTPTGQPITTAVTVSTLKTINTTFSLSGQVLSTAPERVIINFGTGQQIAQTLTSATQYATTQQALYGVWDWDMGTPKTPTTPGTGWNAISGGQQGITLTTGGPRPIALSSLQPQTFNTLSADGVNIRQVSKNPVCWPSSPNGTDPNPSGCVGTNQFGWYINLPVTNGLAEQVIFDPTISPDGEFVVNTFVPPQTSPLICTPAGSTGFSMGLQPDDGQGTPAGYFRLADGTIADGIQLNGVGTPSFVSSGQAADNNSEYLITQTPNGVATPTPLNRNSIIQGQRLNWTQRR